MAVADAATGDSQTISTCVSTAVGTETEVSSTTSCERSKKIHVLLSSFKKKIYLNTWICWNRRVIPTGERSWPRPITTCGRWIVRFTTNRFQLFVVNASIKLVRQWIRNLKNYIIYRVCSANPGWRPFWCELDVGSHARWPLMSGMLASRNDHRRSVSSTLTRT